MRLFGKLDSQISPLDRAQWLTPPFDRRQRSANAWRAAAGQLFVFTGEQAAARTPGGAIQGKARG